MDKELLERALYHGFRVRFSFLDLRPTFGDLFLIRGFAHPQFPPTGHFNFSALGLLGFDQVDDYFGIRTYDEEGGDMKVWLYPLVGGQRVYHHSGPFDGLELSYDALRNRPQNAALFLEVVTEFAHHLPVQVFYELRGQELGNPPELARVKGDLDFVSAYWRSRGIEPGSDDALMVKR